MKSFTLILKAISVFVVILSFSGCSKDNEKDSMTKITLRYPIYETRANVLANIKSSEPRQMESPGKIFIYGKYLFINEIDKGVHIFDNSDARKPRPVSFINIPGNLDVAVKGNTLYADMYSDLVTVDISQPLNAKLLKNVTHVFPERSYYYDSNLVVVAWTEKDTLVEGGIWMEDCIGCNQTAWFALASSNKASGGAPGIAGSMARFAIVNDYLYAVNSWNLSVFDIHSPADPELKSAQNAGFAIETIYPFKDKLFIGSSNGMYIYDITQPDQPQKQSEFTHVTACDPVVADERYAYVTLRSGSRCMGINNQLEVIDINDVFNPALITTYSLKNPHGLAKDDNLLFICDGDDGLKVYDASNPVSLKLRNHIKGMKAYDVIAWNKRLLLVADEGLYQYDYSGNITQLSVIRTKSSRSWLK
jgi:hypothetical protein